MNAKILIAYITGILMGFLMPSGPIVAYILPGFLFFLPLLFVLSTYYHPYGKLALMPYIYLGIFLSGFVGLQISDPKNKEDYYGMNGQARLGIQVEEPSYFSGNILRFRSEILYYKNKNGIRRSSGPLLVSLIGMKAHLSYGSLLEINGILKSIPGNPHPGFFNYSFYEKIHHQNYQVFLKPEQYKILKINTGNPLWRWIYSIQGRAGQVLERVPLDSLSQHFLQTLLIGGKSSLDAENLQTFIQTGTVHILSISGLHIALLFSLFNWILYPIKTLGEGGRFVHLILIHGLLWLYAFMSGASPPVLRSATMLSLFSIAKIFRRKTNSVQVIVSSALIQLIFSPIDLFDLSFQLTYSALFSLIKFQKPIQALFNFQNPILKQVNGILSASLAAQLGTLPISLFYFHQFPVYFLIGNVFVIPFSGFILYEGVLLFISEGIGIHLPYLTKLLQGSIHLLIQGLGSIAELPFGVLQGIFFDIPGFCLLSLLVIYLYFWMIWKRKIWMHGTFLWLSLFLIYQETGRRIRSHKECIFIYSGYHSFFSFINREDKAWMQYYMDERGKYELVKNLRKTLPVLIRYHRVHKIHISPYLPGNKIQEIGFESLNKSDQSEDSVNHRVNPSQSNFKENTPYKFTLSPNFNKYSSIAFGIGSGIIQYQVIPIPNFRKTSYNFKSEMYFYKEYPLEK